MSAEDLIGRICSEIRAKSRMVHDCIKCAPALYRNYMFFRGRQFSRKASWFNARNVI